MKTKLVTIDSHFLAPFSNLKNTGVDSVGEEKSFFLYPFGLLAKTLPFSLTPVIKALRKKTEVQ